MKLIVPTQATECVRYCVHCIVAIQQCEQFIWIGSALALCFVSVFLLGCAFTGENQVSHVQCESKEAPCFFFSLPFHSFQSFCPILARAQSLDIILTHTAVDAWSFSVDCKM